MLQYRYKSPERSTKLSTLDAFPAVSTTKFQRPALSETYDSFGFGLHRPSFADEHRFYKTAPIQKAFPPFHTIGDWKRWAIASKAVGFGSSSEKTSLVTVRKDRIKNQRFRLFGISSVYKSAAVVNQKNLERTREIKKTLKSASKPFHLVEGSRKAARLPLIVGRQRKSPDFSTGVLPFSEAVAESSSSSRTRKSISFARIQELFIGRSKPRIAREKAEERRRAASEQVLAEEEKRRASAAVKKWKKLPALNKSVVPML